MTDRGLNLSPIKWFGPIVAIIALTNITILLDIPALRQIFGFIFLTFVPGFLILLVLKLNRLGLLEKIVLSVGLSVAFSMLFGLAVNSSSLAFGYTRPLSTVPLLISFSIATILLAVTAYIRNRGIPFSLPNLKLTTRGKAFLIIPSLFPLLSIVGMRIMNLTDNNVLLMALLFLIPAYVIFISFYRSKVPERVYPAAIFLIGISLLLMLSLRSNHILGSDIHDWYYTFQVTLDNSHWGVLGPNLFDPCLSISLLPSIYHIFLNINPEYLFKILYSLLFSISPLVVYVIAKKYIGNFYAFLASCFFMTQVVFLNATGCSSTILAILFFALAIMVLVHDGIGEFAKRLLFIIFAASCIVSHYSTTYIFFFVLLLTWIGMEVIPRMLVRDRKAAALSDNSIIPQSHLKKRVTITIVALFFTILIFWYSQVTATAFNVGVGFIHQTFTNLNEWFIMEAKGGTITRAAGEGIHTIPQRIRLVVSWLTVAFIAIGVLSTLVRYKRMVSVPKSGDAKPDFLYSKFEMEYFILALVCSAILAASVILPYIMRGYSMERAYFQTLVALSPFFVIGGIMVAKWLKARPHWIILMVLIPFFMCTTGTMYQIFGYPASIVLNSAGKEYDSGYVHDRDSYAAKWIGEYGKEGIARYTGTWPGPRVFESQALIPLSRIKGSFVSQYEKGREINGYIYLRCSDTAEGGLVTEYPDVFTGKNKIYATGGSEVYR